MLWSVAQYAAPNIRGCFRKGENTDVIITDEIDLTGYSYYPVTPIGAVNLGNNQGKTTSLNFDYDGMNEKENENKKLYDSDHQHYLMQHGLFYNAYRNIAVKNTSFSGTVGKEQKDGTTYNSGALIYGSVAGDPVKYIVEITLNRVTLAGIRVTDVDKNNVTYAPLLINQMEKAVKLTVDTLSTGEGYKDSDKTVYAATSLIGNVGNNNATKLTPSFSNIALDGRVAADTANAISVYNNGNVPVEYHTTHTIFTKATLLESFMYSSEGSGTYNFNSTDKMVTYGVELTNAESTGRNPDKQYQYYDGEIYIRDEYEGKDNAGKDIVGTGAAGGLTGLCEWGSVEIKNVNVTQLTVTGKNVRDVGGLIAAGREKDFKTFSIDNCILEQIKITLSNDQTKKDNHVGGVIGYNQKILKVSNVKIMGESSIEGQIFVGGFVGVSNGVTTISGCEEKDINLQANLRWIGGFIGYVGNTIPATFQNCQAQNVNILGRYVGGLVGAIAGSITASNMEFKNVMAVTKYSNTRYAGLITGNTRNNANSNPNSINGYNILADSCKTGYSNVSDVKDLQTAKLTQIKTSGLWIGNNGTKTTTKLVAVAAKGDVFPQNDIGTDSANNTIIIYADKTAEKTYTPSESTEKPSSSANPWLDVNPKSNVPFADGTVMTGNAVGMLQTAESDTKGTETARKILSELKEDAPVSDYYWNLADNKNEFVKFLDSTNDAYITTYRAEESATTTVSENVDFPVLVVNNSAEVDAMLWNYIAAMTNVKNGDTAKKQKTSITATSYKWDTTENNFKAQDSASLKVSETNKITIVPNAYDNQNSQFTLLDVTYADPTDSKNTHAFHLYIPVLVKKVLYISFKTRFIAGTDYCAADYPMNDSDQNHYATAGFNEPLTAYIEYSYEKETDWQSMLDNGENLLWYYDKVLDLAFGSTEESGKKLLPTGTRLTLVDRQTMQYYTYTTTGEEDFHNFNLSKLQLPSAESSDTSEDKNFKPVYICDLLGLTATQADSQDEAKTYYVKVGNDSKDTATVRVGNEYYRKAEEKDIKDEKATKYSIAISKDSSSEQEARKESYFLTIQVPAKEGYSVINNRLNYSEIKRNEGTLPAVIKSEKDQSGSAYVIYDGVSQTFKISTSRIHNGNIMSDTAMEDSDSIKINLESKLKLTEAG